MPGRSHIRPIFPEYYGNPYMTRQAKVNAALFAEYRGSGSTIECHRAQIHRFHGNVP